ncbi:MAG: hypothetical protein J5935_05000 [Lachnospiraceae bacterium]|nr:hypothetical protein [Lachnospiraceae bacterium]
MTRVLVGCGKLSATPYYLEKLEHNLYSVEELCYCLVQRAQYLDNSIMDPGLVSWLEEECELPELAKELRPFLGQKRQLSDFVATILHYTRYVSKERGEETRQVVEIGGALEPIEKGIRHADELAENQHLYLAIAEYDAVLNAYPNLEVTMKAVLERKKGLLYANMFRFVPASECFMNAYRLTGDPESYLYYLTAVRLTLSEEEYVSFIAEHPEAYAYSMTLEQRMRDTESAYAEAGMERQIGRLTSFYEAGQQTSFEIECKRMVGELKADYRRQIGES